MSECMQTRSQGPPVSPNIEHGTLPNTKQIARDQAEAVRLARLAAEGNVGLTNSDDTGINSVEQGEILPVNSENQAVNIDSQETARTRQ